MTQHLADTCFQNWIVIIEAINIFRGCPPGAGQINMRWPSRQILGNVLTRGFTDISTLYIPESHIFELL